VDAPLDRAAWVASGTVSGCLLHPPPVASAAVASAAERATIDGMKTPRLLIVLLALTLCSCGGGDSEGKAPPRGDGIEVQGGQFFGGVRRPTFQYVK